MISCLMLVNASVCSGPHWNGTLMRIKSQRHSASSDNLGDEFTQVIHHANE